jgi:hypothetical protein
MRSTLSHGLAMAFLAGPWTAADLVERGRAAVGGAPPWLRPLVRRVIARFAAPPPGGEEELDRWLGADERLSALVARRSPSARVRRWLVPEAAMLAVLGPPAGFAVFPLAAPGDLARHLGLGATELDWFADESGMNARTAREPLLHYRYCWVGKARGGHRLLEAPKPRLKQAQRWILRHVLGPIPPSPFAHGFVAGRSVRSFVEPHLGKEVVVRLDLADFFASIGRARVRAVFRRVGYPPPVAAAMAALCTAPAPLHVLRAHPRPEGAASEAALAQRFATNQRLRGPHLPQGAPTSPALANLAAFRLDRRLAALAAAYGAAMTRYADDLAFSGGPALARNLRFFLPQAAAIALDEGFELNHRKTRVMPRGRRQHLCGLVVNQRPNLPRAEVDDLRALLHNAARFGPASQNRDGHPRFREHLEGRIAWVASINPARGRRLATLFERIQWPRSAPSPGT